MKANLALMF